MLRSLETHDGRRIFYCWKESSPEEAKTQAAKTQDAKQRREKKRTNESAFCHRDEGAAACQTLRARLERIHTHTEIRDTRPIIFEREREQSSRPISLFFPLQSDPVVLFWTISSDDDQKGIRPFDWILEHHLSFLHFHTTAHSYYFYHFTYFSLPSFFFFFLPVLIDTSLFFGHHFRNGGLKDGSLGNNFHHFPVLFVEWTVGSSYYWTEERKRLRRRGGFLHCTGIGDWIGLDGHGGDGRLDGEG
jgi:hypothetical protein